MCFINDGKMNELNLIRTFSFRVENNTHISFNFVKAFLINYL